jgi:hypothetical protein
MGAMAIIALDQAFIHAVVERPCKLRAYIHVTRVTELRGFRLHQKLTLLRIMGRVAINAGNAVGQVHRTVIVPMLFVVLVAAQAASAGLLRRGVLKGEDFGLVAPAIYVLLSRAVASLAAMPLHALVRVEFAIHGGSEVRGGGEIRIDVFVAGLAGIGTHIESGIGRRNIGFDLLRRLGMLCGVLFVVGMGARNRQHRYQHCQKIGDAGTSPMVHRTPLDIAGPTSYAQANQIATDFSKDATASRTRRLTDFRHPSPGPAITVCRSLPRTPCSISAKVAVWWLHLGIDIERIKPGHPQQNDRHKRMHLTLKNEAAKPAAANFLQPQARFDKFIEVLTICSGPSSTRSLEPARVGSTGQPAWF